MATSTDSRGPKRLSIIAPPTDGPAALPPHYEVGIIGMGDMGQLYATVFADAGLMVNVCDLPEKTDELRARYASNSHVRVFSDGFGVARRSDFIVYSVEAVNVEKVVRLYGPSTKVGAIVSGQTSVKAPEIAAFERYLPPDVEIVTCHSLHSAGVSPKGQILVVIPHRCSEAAHRRALSLYALFGSHLVEMSADDHDRITANTQSLTHVGFQAMGTAWKNAGFYPWEHASYLGGIDNIKILCCLRIYGAKWHVYAGLSIMNPLAKDHVRQYARSVSALFKLMIQEDRDAFYDRVLSAGRAVFGDGPGGDGGAAQRSDALLLPDDVLAEYGLGSLPISERKPNSHLSLLAMVDCWHQLGIRPHEHLICQTPIFRLRLGIAEYLFRDRALLEETLEAALYNKKIRADDMEFYASVREWATIIVHGDLDGYRAQFDEAAAFFASRLEDARKASSTLISRLSALQPST